MITSADNSRIKKVISLNTRSKFRKEEDAYIVEGIKMFEEAPEDRVQEVFVSESFAGHYANQDKLRRLNAETVKDDIFKKMTDTMTPQGILCVMKQSHYVLSDIVGQSVINRDAKPSFVLVTEALQDPGNLGTILRTGEGAGITGVIMSKDTVDIYNPKTIRATMGSVYRVPFMYTENLHETIHELKKRQITMFAAHLKGNDNYFNQDYTKSIAFLIGNEGNGLTDETAALADFYVRIPMQGQVESLNAAIAATVLMYETARQRYR